MIQRSFRYILSPRLFCQSYDGVNFATTDGNNDCGIIVQLIRDNGTSTASPQQVAACLFLLLLPCCSPLPMELPFMYRIDAHVDKHEVVEEEHTQTSLIVLDVEHISVMRLEAAILILSID